MDAGSSPTRAMADTGPAFPSVAVIIPCYNEEASIGDVVADFRAALPGATIYVYDNNSNDKTIDRAKSSGATVHSEPLQGKGNVVRRMFADVDAEIYVMVDGDATYDASAAPKLVQRLVDEQLDMVVGTRLRSGDKEAFRQGHRWGNVAMTRMVGGLFGARFNDIFSGYRVFSRRFVKSFPALSAGFEIETELTVHALELRLPVAEIETAYGARGEGSASKLNTFRDGIRILRVMTLLFKEVKPLWFFMVIAASLAGISIGLAAPIVEEFVKTGLVPRIPTAILCTGLMLLSFISVTCGLILDSVAAARLEAKRMAYLSVPAPTSERASGSQ